MSRWRSRWLVVLLGLGLASSTVAGGPGSIALAHERVVLTSQHATPARGPLLKDGTIARAAFIAFDGLGQRRGLRVQFDAGQDLRMELLIPDAAPANRLPRSALPEVVVLGPDGTRTLIPLTERTPFYEPYTQTSYLYLGRLRERAVPGIYRVQVTSRTAEPMTAVLGIGYREVAGH